MAWTLAMCSGCSLTPRLWRPEAPRPPDLEILRPVVVTHPRTGERMLVNLPPPPPRAESLDPEQLDWLAAVTRDLVLVQGYIDAFRETIGATGDAT